MSASALKFAGKDESSFSPVGSPTKAKVRKLCDAPHLPQKTSSPAAREKLTLQYRDAARKLALSMISKWKCRIERDELQSVIDLALCEAATRYNHSHGAGFMTFLYYHLKGKLIKTIVQRADRALVFIEDYESSRLAVSGDDEFCNVRSVEWLCLATQAQSNHLEADDALYRQQLIDICHKACERLRGIEREVIWQIYFQNKELSQVTSEMGYSRGHLFRVRMRALNKIRRAVKAYC